ncbi:MAG: NADAR domain-containing protein [Endozoicomonas sp.]
MWRTPAEVQVWLEGKGYTVVSGVKRAAYRNSVMENGKFEALVEPPEGIPNIPGALWMPVNEKTYMWIAIWYRGLQEKWCLRCGRPGHFRNKCPEGEQRRTERQTSYAQAASQVRHVMQEANLADNWAEGTERMGVAQDQLQDIMSQVKAQHYSGMYKHRSPFSEEHLQMSEDPVKVEQLLWMKYEDWVLPMRRGFLPFYNGRHVFSNFFKTRFTVARQGYESVEQAYFHLMCLEAGMKTEAFLVMQTRNPLEVKNLSRLMNIKQVAMENGVTLQKMVEIMKRCVRAKFESTWFLRNALLVTDGYDLLEANPYDDFWGIGGDTWFINRPDFKVRKTNKLGTILAEVREELKEEYPEEWKEVNERIIVERPTPEAPEQAVERHRSGGGETQGQVGADEPFWPSGYVLPGGRTEETGAESDEMSTAETVESQQDSMDEDSGTEPGINSTAQTEDEEAPKVGHEGTLEASEAESDTLSNGSEKTKGVGNGGKKQNQKKKKGNKRKNDKWGSGSSASSPPPKVTVSQSESPTSGTRAATPKARTDSESRIQQRAQSVQARIREIRERSSSAQARGSQPRAPFGGSAIANMEHKKTAPKRVIAHVRKEKKGKLIMKNDCICSVYVNLW